MKKYYKKSIITVLVVALLVGNLSNVCLIKAKGNRFMKVRTLENIVERSKEEKNGYILISSKRGRISQNDNLNKISLNKSHIIKEIGVVDKNKAKIINKYRDKPDIYMEQNYIAKGNPLTDTFLSRMQKVSITP